MTPPPGYADRLPTDPALDEPYPSAGVYEDLDPIREPAPMTDDDLPRDLRPGPF